MAKENIKINDFSLFHEIIRSLSKMADGVKFTVNECGVTIYAKNDFSKCEITSNSITSDNKLEFCIGDIDKFNKVLSTVSEIYKNGDITSVKLFFDSPFIKIESSKFKTKISTTDESKILNFIGTKVKTDLTPQLEFTTNSNMIKSINSHSFIFNDSTAPRVYLTTEKEMENNVVFATIGDEKNELANSLTLELGLLNFGTMNDRKVILDFNRLNLLNMVPSDEIKVQLANERPVLSTSVKKIGKNDTFFNINLYIFMMVR